MPKAQLKKPLGIYLLALLFICAPLGNIILSLAGSGANDWYKPSVFMLFLAAIPVSDWIWLSLIGATGILLFWPHKTTWTIALITLFVVSSINTYKYITTDFAVNSAGLQPQLILSTVITISMMIMIFYFRYPYLDRRSGWFLQAMPRYDIRTPVDVVAQDIYEGVTESISLSGARLRLRRDMDEASAHLRYVDLILPDLRNMKIKARVLDYRGNVLRLKFKDLKGPDRSYMLGWFQSQNETNPPM